MIRVIVAIALLHGCGTPTTPTATPSSTSPDPSSPPDPTPPYDPFDGLFTPADVSDQDAVSALTVAIPRSLLTFAQLPLTLADQNDDPQCPAVTLDEGRTTLQGDCIDSTGVMWVGTATVESVDEDPQISYTDFGVRFPAELCDDMTPLTESISWNGVLRLMDARYELELELNQAVPDIERCELLVEEGRASYAAEVEFVESREIWSGAGVVGATPYGWAMVETIEEVFDEAICNSEPLAGTTTLASDGHEAVLTYDGLTSCDPAGAVPWALDGVEQGTVTLSGCSHGAAPQSAGVVLFLLALLYRRRV